MQTTPARRRCQGSTVTRWAGVFLVAATAMAVSVVGLAGPAGATPVSTALPYAYTASTIPAGTGPAGVAVDQSTHTAYVSNDNSNTVMVIDTLTNRVTDTIDVNPGGFDIGPIAVGVDEGTHSVYVANVGGNSITVIDTRTNTVTATVSAGEPVALTVDQSTHTAYILGHGPYVAIMDTVTNQITKDLFVGGTATAVAVDDGTHTAYVTNTAGLDVSANGRVSTIDTRTNTVTGTFAVGVDPEAAAVDLSTHTAYVTNHGRVYDNNSSVSVIDTLTNQVTATIPLGDDLPYRVSIEQSTHTAYVTSINDISLTYAGTVSVINTLTNQVEGALDVGKYPEGVAVDEGTHTVYVTNNGANSISVLEAHGDKRITATTVHETTTAVENEPVVLQATVAPATVGGTVAFSAGDGLAFPGCAAVPVVGGRASCTTTLRFAQGYSIFAVYSGDATHAISRGYDALTVLRHPTTTTISASPNAAVGVAGVALFATFTASTPIAAPQVSSFLFLDDGVPIPGCGNIVHADSPTTGSASCITTFTTPGVHTISAEYGGDTDHAMSSASIPVDVSASPNLFQVVLGYLITFAHNLHLFGL